MNPDKLFSLLSPKQVLSQESQQAYQSKVDTAKAENKMIKEKVVNPFFSFADKSFKKIMEVLNPGESYVAPALKKMGVNPILAGGIGLGVDILAPGPGELGRVAKVGKEIKVGSELLQESRKYKSAEEFVKAVTKDRGGVGRGVDYSPAKRLVETSLNDKPITDFGFKPNDKITIYRGVDNATQKTIKPGDYIALSRDLAKSYTGGKVISQKVPASSIRVSSGDGLTIADFKDINNLHIEAVYNPNPLIKPSQLTDIWKKANETKDLTQEARKYKSAEEFVKANIDENKVGRFVKEKDYKVEGGNFSEYLLNNNQRLGRLTVEKSKTNGWRIRNVFVDDGLFSGKNLQRQGIATDAYRKLNEQSLLETGKPLRSSDVGYAKRNSVTTLSDKGEALWKKLVKNGEAELVDDTYYRFNPKSQLTDIWNQANKKTK